MTENNTEITHTDTKKPNKSYSYESAKTLSVAFELGFIIALPIVVLALFGKWLDQRQGTHYFVYIGIILAIISTSITIYRRFAAMIEKLNQAADIKPTGTDKK